MTLKEELLTKLSEARDLLSAFPISQEVRRVQIALDKTGVAATYLPGECCVEENCCKEDNGAEVGEEQEEEVVVEYISEGKIHADLIPSEKEDDTEEE